MLLAAWTFGSIALFVIAARLSATAAGRRARVTLAGHIAAEGARLAFYVGTPYAALLAGAFAPRDVGLQGSPSLDLILGWTPEAWTRTTGQAAALGGLTLVAIVALARQVRRAGGFAPLALGVDHVPIARSIREAAYAEAHWAFYRALPIALLADAHWAALAGLALAAAEALIAGQRTERIRPFEALVAGMSATLFALSGGNAWVAVALQIGVRAVAARLAYTGHAAEPPNEIIV